MKRSDLLLKAAPIAALAACSGGAASLLTNPASQLLRAHPAKGSGSCGANLYSTKFQIVADIECEDGWWAEGTLDLSPKFHEVADYIELQWCGKPRTACNFPNTTKIDLPWGVDGERWLKKQLIKLWEEWGFLPDPKGNGGKLYSGVSSFGSGSGSGTLVTEIAVNANEYGSGSYLELGGTADLTMYGQGSDATQKYKVPWGKGSNRRRRHDISGKCLGDDINCAGAFAAFAVAVFAAETGIGAIAACALFLSFMGAAVTAKADGCF